MKFFVYENRGNVFAELVPDRVRSVKGALGYLCAKGIYPATNKGRIISLTGAHGLLLSTLLEIDRAIQPGHTFRAALERLVAEAAASAR